MSKVNNVFTVDILDMLNTATDLDHLVTFVPWLHKLAEPTIKKSNEILKKRGAPPNSFGPGTGLSIVNVFHDGQYITRAPAGKRITQGDDVRRMAEEIEGRMNASLLTVLHESWEIFLKRVYAKLLFHLKVGLAPPRRAEFHKATPKWRNYRNTPEYFRDYAHWACRVDCSEALRLFVKSLAWNEMQITGWDGMDWSGVSRILAFCRHCIVHNEGRVSETRWKRLNKPQAALVRTMMKKTILSDDERILPPARLLDRFIEAIVSLAYGLYVLLSQRCDMDVENALFKKADKPKS
jgi:hypothetical protein